MKPNRQMNFKLGLCVTAAVCITVILGVVHTMLRTDRQYDVYARNLPVFEFAYNLAIWNHIHGQPPRTLDALVPQADGKSTIEFGTPPGWKCKCRYMPNVSGRRRAVAYFRCGQPVLQEFWIAADGEVIRKREYSHRWWRILHQQKQYPELYVRQLPSPPASQSQDTVPVPKLPGAQPKNE